MAFGKRLSEERKRLGLNQTEFGKIGNVTKTSQVNYESGERSPNVDYWQAIAAIGADVQYILTGSRSLVSGVAESPDPYRAGLTRRQLALLDNLAHCAEEDRAAIERIALAAKTAQQSALAQPWDGKDRRKQKQ